MRTFRFGLLAALGLLLTMAGGARAQTFASDNFTPGATGTDIAGNALTLGGVWTRGTGTGNGVKVAVGNRVRPNNASNLFYYPSTGTPASANYYAQCDVTVYANTANAYIGPAARVTAGGAAYWVAVDAQYGAWELYGGNGTSAAKIGQLATAIATGAYTVRLEVSGSTITVYEKLTSASTFTKIITVTDTAATAAGNAGIGFGGGVADGNGADISNFAAGSLNAVSYAFSGVQSVTNGSPNTLTLTPNNPYTGTITLSDNGAGGAFSPASLTWTNDASAKTFTYTPATTGSITLTASASPALFCSNAGGNYVLTSGASAVAVAVTDANIYYSPYNWYSDGAGVMQANNILPGATFAESSLTGSYFKVPFTGTSCGVKLNTAATTGTLTAAYSVDGGAWQAATITNGLTSVSVASGLTNGTHTLYWYYKLYASDANVWIYANPRLAYKFTGLMLDSGAATASAVGTIIALRPKIVMTVGDSITRSEYETNDAKRTYAAYLANALGGEEGRLGYSSTGWAIASGFTNAAGFWQQGAAITTTTGTTWTNYDDTHVRPLSGGLLQPQPDYIVNNHGHNDTVLTAAIVQAWMTDARAKAPSAWIICLCPFYQDFDATVTGGTNAAAIQAGVNAYKTAFPADSKVAFVHNGFWASVGLNGGGATVASLDGVHPAVTRHGQLGAASALNIQSAIAPGGSGLTGANITAIAAAVAALPQIAALPTAAAGANGGLPVLVNGTVNSNLITIAGAGNAVTATGGVTFSPGTVSTYAGGDTAGTTTLLTRVTGAVPTATQIAAAILGNGGTVTLSMDASGRVVLQPTQIFNTTGNITGNLSGSVTVGGYAANQDPATLIFGSPRWQRVEAVEIGNYTRAPSTGVITFTRSDGTTFTATVAVDGTGKITGRVVSP